MEYLDRAGLSVQKPSNKKPKSRTSAYGILIKDDMIFMVRPTFRNTWELPGGKKEKNETTTEALKREFLEETEMEIIDFFKKPVHEAKSKFYADDLDEYYNSNLKFFMIKKIKEQPDAELDDEEIYEYKWKRLKDVNKKNTHPIHLEAIDKIRL